MAVSIVEQPSTTQPTPVSDCLIWQFEHDDADFVESGGSIPYIEILWPGSPTAPANGTQFTIWGYVFEIQSGTAYTSTTFRVVTGNMEQTRANFKAMIESNYFFRQATTVSNAPTSTTVITWGECREQERFAGTNMDVAELETMGCTVTVSNGVSPVYVEGYKLLTRLMLDDGTGTLKNMTEFEITEVDNQCGIPFDSVRDFMPDVRQLIYFPAFANGFLQLNDSSQSTQGMYLKVGVEYGFVYRENCQPKSGTFAVSNIVSVLNAAFPLEFGHKMREFFPGATGGLPGSLTHYRFLTSQPKTHEISINSYAWLWFFTNRTAGIDSDDIWQSEIVYTLTDGTTGTYTGTALDSHSGLFGENAGGYVTLNWNLQCINVSPEFVINKTAATSANLAKYTVKIMSVIDGGTPTQLTEELTYEISGRNGVMGNACFVSGGANGTTGGATDLYFVMPESGLGTLLVSIDEKEINQDAVEILLDVPCEATRLEAASMRGKSFTGVRSYDRLTFRVVRNYTDADVAFFANFKRSPQRWVQVPSDDGYTGYIAKKLLIEPGGIKIYKSGEKIELIAIGYLQDTPIQSSLAEPAIF